MLTDRRGSAAVRKAPTGFQLTGSSAERYEDAVGTLMLPLAAHLVGQAGISAGADVLDLACGTGFVARLAAQVVGPEGRVVGLDVNPAMVAEARRVTGLDIVEASAGATGLRDGTFDAVVCQQGLQYFPDPKRAVVESARVLRPGGRVAMSVWADFERNPFRVGQLRAMERHLRAEDVTAYRKTSVTSLGGVGGVAELFESAGLRDVDVVEHELVTDLPPMDDFVPKLMAATPWAATFGGLEHAERVEVIRHMEGVVTTGPDGQGGSVPMTVVVATAVAPRRAIGSHSVE